jgi:hypothetical protein
MSPLLLLGLYDELWSGVAVVAAPAVEEKLALGHAGYALWVFALPILLSALIEAPLALWSDRVGRRALLMLGTFGLGGSLLLAGLAHAPWLFALALSLAGAASGAACGAAQGELIATSPLGGARAMSRWTVFAALGDALAPFFVAAAVWLGHDYRGALCLLGLSGLAQACAQLWRSGVTAAEPTACVAAHASREPDDDAALFDSRPDPSAAPPSSLRALRGALRQRPRLFSFLLASSVCCLLDEIVVALAALRFRLDQAHSLSITALGSMLVAVGSVKGALLSDLALTRFSMRSILLTSGFTCLVALGALASASSLSVSLFALWLIGLSAAPHHALMTAAAYEEAPGSPGVVNAALQLFVGIEIGAPLLVGLVAWHAGIPCALLALSVQPLVILIVAQRLLRGARGAKA